MHNTKIKLSILALLISISWFVISFILNKDLIGGAFHDFKYHLKSIMFGVQKSNFLSPCIPVCPVVSWQGSPCGRDSVVGVRTGTPTGHIEPVRSGRVR